MLRLPSDSVRLTCDMCNQVYLLYQGTDDRGSSPGAFGGTLGRANNSDGVYLYQMNEELARTFRKVEFTGCCAFNEFTGGVKYPCAGGTVFDVVPKSVDVPIPPPASSTTIEPESTAATQTVPPTEPLPTSTSAEASTSTTISSAIATSAAPSPTSSIFAASSSTFASSTVKPSGSERLIAQVQMLLLMLAIGVMFLVI